MGEIKYMAGIYMRLSKDDERMGESVSIKNQRLLLTKYVEEKGWEIRDTYIDDGWSGTNFQRPGFQRMMQDVEEKRINVIIVKDLSRLGRNYIEVGKLTDETLPALGCRFIALNDSVDTIMGENDMMVYRNLFNEFYSRDTSKKVRAVKKACAENGKYLGTYAPLGYRKSDENKHKLVVDEETAPIVRRIFALRATGTGLRAIAILLNEERVPAPMAIIERRTGKNSTRPRYWSDITINAILRNEVYIGNLIGGKQGTQSYKSRKIVKRPEEQWIRVENTHEPLIDRKTWDIVCSMFANGTKKRRMKDGTQNMFVGLLKCADCGFNLRISVSNRSSKEGTSYTSNSFMCGNYARSGKLACTIHYISEDTLTQLILSKLRECARLVAYDEQRVVNSIVKVKSQENTTFLATYKREFSSTEARLKQLDGIIQTLYEDRVKGVVTDNMFKNLMGKYERERDEKSETMQVLREKVEAAEKQWCDIDSWLKIIREYRELSELNPETLWELIEKIEISEAEKIKGRRICNIRVFYRFVGDIGDALAEQGGGRRYEQDI